MKDAPLSYMLRQASIQTQNQLMFFSDYIWKDCPGNGRSTGAYMIFYQGNTIDHEKYVPGPVAQSSAQSEYNEACNAGMDLENFRMLIHEVFEHGS